MNALIAAFLFQAVFGSVRLGSVRTEFITPDPIELTADCDTETQAAWTAMGWDNITPLQEDAADTQAGDVCRGAAPAWPTEGL